MDVIRVAPYRPDLLNKTGDKIESNVACLK